MNRTCTATSKRSQSLARHAGCTAFNCVIILQNVGWIRFFRCDLQHQGPVRQLRSPPHEQQESSINAQETKRLSRCCKDSHWILLPELHRKHLATATSQFVAVMTRGMRVKTRMADIDDRESNFNGMKRTCCSELCICAYPVLYPIASTRILHRYLKMLEFFEDAGRALSGALHTTLDQLRQLSLDSISHGSDSTARSVNRAHIGSGSALYRTMDRRNGSMRPGIPSRFARH